MNPGVFELLKDRVAPENVLEEIALMVYSYLRGRDHVEPGLKEMIFRYPSFEKMLDDEEAFVKAGFDNACADIQDLLEMELDDIFDEAEDSVKEFLRGAGASAVIEDMRKKNVLVLPHPLSEDEVEMFYLSDFQKLDRLKEALEKRVFELSPQKAYYQGEKAWKAVRKEEHILMDDAELLDEFMKDYDPEAILALLCHDYYMAIQFGRHYEPQSAEDEEDDEEDPNVVRLPFADADEDEDGEISFLPPEESEEGAKEPDILIPGGDLRDCSFTYVGELFDEYTGSRSMAPEEEGGAYWSTYGDRFWDLAFHVVSIQLERTLERLSEQKKKELLNLAEQYSIPKDRLTDPEAFLDTAEEFGMNVAELLERQMDEFGDLPSEEAISLGSDLHDGFEAYMDTVPPEE